MYANSRDQEGAISVSTLDTLVSCGLTADSCNKKYEVKKYPDSFEHIRRLTGLDTVGPLALQ